MGSFRAQLKNLLSSNKDKEQQNQTPDPADSVAPPPSYDAAVNSTPSQPAAAPSLSPAPQSSRPRSSSHLSPYGPGNPDPALEITNDSLTSLGDPWAFLGRFDTKFLIDDSGSMSGRNWREVKQVLNQIVPMCIDRDADGVDIEFLNSKHKFLNCNEEDIVETIFRQVFPTAATPTGRRLGEMLNPYLSDYESRVRTSRMDPKKTGLKPVNLIVITDGVPTDTNSFPLKDVIRRIAKRLDDVKAPIYQIGIQFFQVGRDSGAAAALAELDDDLCGSAKRGKLRDIVDTATFDINDGSENVLTMEAIMKVVLGAVVRKVDNQVLADQRTNR